MGTRDEQARSQASEMGRQEGTQSRCVLVHRELGTGAFDDNDFATTFGVGCMSCGFRLHGFVDDGASCRRVEGITNDRPWVFAHAGYSVSRSVAGHAPYHW